MIEFTYGANSQFIDVTQRASLEFVKKNELKIEKECSFNVLFGDPIPNVEKHLLVKFTDKTTVSFPEQRTKNYTIKLLQSMPKTIVQYWNSSEENEPMPEWALHNSAVIKFHHRDFEYKLFNRKQAIDFIRNYFSTATVVAFCKCAVPAMQSDFFRYCYLFAAGGFYFDLKTQCLAGFLYEYLDSMHEMLLLTRDHNFLYNGFIGAQAGALALRDTIAECTENILKENYTELYLTTGTPVLTKHCQNHYGDKYEKAQTMYYDNNRCPIIFGGQKYNSDHWSLAEKKKSIYVNISLKDLLQVDQIFLLNLDSRTDRLQECIEEFKKLGVNPQQWERFSALRGANPFVQQKYLQEYQVFSKALEAHGKKYIDGAFGCLVSHHEMIKLAKERGYKRVLILEDDFEATDLLFDQDLLQSIGNTNFDMFYLSASHALEPTQSSVVGIKKVARALSTAAYIIDQSIYTKVLQECLVSKKQVDVYFADAIHTEKNVLCTERCAIVQRESFSDIIDRRIKYSFV